MENKGPEGVEMAPSSVMENKRAEGVQVAPAAAKTVVEEATFTESAKDRLRQFKDAVAGEYWVSIKNKVRDAGEYATLRARQGISMFGEPKIDATSVIVDHC